tara:strand:- start:2029 stop:2502 length:474 start_codon:yes stop_codon:yes gene_type:complete
VSLFDNSEPEGALDYDNSLSMFSDIIKKELITMALLELVKKLTETDNVVTLKGTIGTWDTNSTDQLKQNKLYINGLFFVPTCNSTFNNAWKVTYKGAKDFEVIQKMISEFNENASDKYDKIECVVTGKPTNANYKNQDTDVVRYQQGIEITSLEIVE